MIVYELVVKPLLGLEVFVTEKDMKRRTLEIAILLNQKFRNKKLTVVISLKGAKWFANEVIKHLSPELDIRIVNVRIKSYREDKAGQIQVLLDLDKNDIIGRDVVVIEDIVDSGITIIHLISMIKAKGGCAITVVAMIDKPNDHDKINSEVNEFIVGFVYKEKKFLIGCGLDYDEFFRLLRNLYKIPKLWKIRLFVKIVKFFKP